MKPAVGAFSMMLLCVLAFTHAHAQQPAAVTVVNTSQDPVPVSLVPSGPERISIRAVVSLANGMLGSETGSLYEVPAEKVLVIENVQYDTSAACFYVYVPLLIVDRPVEGGVRFDRYRLAMVSPTAFTNGGGAFLSAATHRVSINAPALADVRFGFSRSSGACFGQIQFLVDGRLEPR